MRTSAQAAYLEHRGEYEDPERLKDQSRAGLVEKLCIVIGRPES